MELKFAKSEVSRLQQNLQDLQEGNHVLQDKLTVSWSLQLVKCEIILWAMFGSMTLLQEAEFQENESRQRIQSLEKKVSKLYILVRSSPLNRPRGPG